MLPIPAPPETPPFEPLPRLVVRGHVFALESGERFTAIECTDFQLYQRFLGGEDIRPVLDQRAALGFTTVRALGMCAGMFHLVPHERPDFSDLLAPFCDACASFGLYVEFTVFADATVVMPDRAQQAAHWLAVGAAAQPITNLLLELGNELDQSINRLAAVNDVQPIPGVLCAHGSNGSQAVPVRPWWHYETAHFNDAPEWQRKTSHNAMEYSDGAAPLVGSHVPILSNENTRPDRDGHLNHFQDAAAGAALLCAGSCFHCEGGKFSRLFDASEHQFAAAWVAGARSVPLEFQDGAYIRRDDLLTPELLRVYERRLSDGRGFIVKIRK